MSQEPTWKTAEKAGTDKPMKEIVEVYDEHCGHYEDHTGGKADSLRPSKNTKTPFGGLSGGK
jgi:hypothetical protein